MQNAGRRWVCDAGFSRHPGRRLEVSTTGFRRGVLGVSGSKYNATDGLDTVVTPNRNTGALHDSPAVGSLGVGADIIPSKSDGRVLEMGAG